MDFSRLNKNLRITNQRDEGMREDLEDDGRIVFETERVKNFTLK
jgi:hypothetical protein